MHLWEVPPHDELVKNAKEKISETLSENLETVKDPSKSWPMDRIRSLSFFTDFLLQMFDLRAIGKQQESTLPRFETRISFTYNVQSTSSTYNLAVGVTILERLNR